jgi:hypothetical protein
MSDSGPTGLPPARPATVADGIAANRNDSLKVTTVSGMLRHVARAQHIAGEVGGENKSASPPPTASSRCKSPPPGPT